MNTIFYKTSRTLSVVIATLFAQSAAQPAYAAEAVTAASAETQDGWSASFGLGVGRTSLTGISDKAKAFPLFSVDYQHGAFFAGLSKGIGYHVVQVEALTLTTSLIGVAGRREKESTRFKSLGDVKASAAANINAEWTPSGSPFAFIAGYTKAFGKNLGASFNVGIGADCPLDDKWRINANLSANYADKRRMQTLYGITPSQSSQSVYPAFTTKAGVESVEFGVGLSYAVDKKWTIVGNIGANRLQGEAAKSLIFKDKTTAVGTLLASYKF